MHQKLTKEACWALLLTFIYVLGWVGFAYFSPQGTGILGFPIWFELSCVLLPIIFTIVASLVIQKVYKNIELEVKTDE